MKKRKKPQSWNTRRITADTDVWVALDPDWDREAVEDCVRRMPLRNFCAGPLTSDRGQCCEQNGYAVAYHSKAAAMRDARRRFAAHVAREEAERAQWAARYGREP